MNAKSPRCNQPVKINRLLKPHQLACLYKAIKMENEGTITYNISPETYQTFYSQNYNNINPYRFVGNVKISTNIGIIGDIVGYGKTLTALSIIAQNHIDNIHINDVKTHSYHSNKAYNYFTAVSSNANIPILNNMINSTLIIVPRGPVYLQWEKTLRDGTGLKYLAIDNLNYIKKNLPLYDKHNIESII